MSFATWHRALKSVVARYSMRQLVRSKRPARRMAYPPRLETLEDRLSPAVLTTLASFNGSNGQSFSGVIEDSSGNLFGTTVFGGASNDGTVFELAAGSNSITTLASFNGSNGQSPYGLIEDSCGNLFGTTSGGGANGDGTVFEVQLPFVVTSTADSGAGSLRQAILDADADTCGTATILFDIPTSDPGYNSTTGSWTITPATALPAITAPVIIDGTSQPSYAGTPIIALNGSQAGSGVPGLDIRGGNSTVKGLAIQQFQQYGLVLDGYGGDTVADNFIGTDVTGSAAMGNSDGILVLSADNTIGGTTVAARNVISGNGGDAINISGSAATGNVVEGNYIGVDASGTKALGNQGNGVDINNGAQNNRVGISATDPDPLGERNIISGNGGNGVQIWQSGTNNNTVAGSYIGTNAAGTAVLGNGGSGILIENDASANIIGGSSSLDPTTGRLTGAGNLISGNAGSGVQIFQANGNLLEGNFIGTDVTGENALGNDPTGFYDDIDLFSGSNNTIGGTSSIDAHGNLSGLGNLISGTLKGTCVWIADNTFSNGTYTGPTTNNAVEGNFIGTNINGTVSLANGNGVVLDSVGLSDTLTDNTIGGATAGLGNLITSYYYAKVFIGGAGAANNVVEGNEIGTNAAGTTAIPNQSTGVRVTNGANNNTIGGLTAAARNIISGNYSYGILIDGIGTDGNLIEGNNIGTDGTGIEPLGNHNAGVVIESGASNNTIGGADAGAGNLISGNSNDGVLINGANQNIVAGNYIGVDASGTKVLGNQGNGVEINNGAQNNRVGVSAADLDPLGERNIISGNGGNGVQIWQSGTTNNVVAGNYIGTDATGTIAEGNGGDGVDIVNGSSNNTIGGTVLGAGNLIANNGGDGVLVSGTNNYLQNNTYQANINYALELSAGGQAYVTGTVSDSVNDNGTIDTDGANLSVGTLTGTGVVTNSGAFATFTGTGGGSFGGSITGANTALTVDGSGRTLVLWGNSSYGGQTTIDATDSLQVGRGNASASIGSGSVIDNGVLEFDVNNADTFANSISGTGGLIQAGIGTLTLTGSNTYSGTTTINTGMTLQAGSATAIAARSAVNDLGTLNLNGFNSTIGTLSGSGTVTNNLVTVYQIDNGRVIQRDGKIYYSNNSYTTEPEDNWVANVFTAAAGAMQVSSISFASYQPLSANNLPSPQVTAALYTGSPSTGLTLAPGSVNTVPLNTPGGT